MTHTPKTDSTQKHLKKFWTLLKIWHANPITKYSAEDIVSWLDDYVKDPKKTLDILERMNKKFEEETK